MYSIFRRLVHINGNQIRTGMTLQIDQKLYYVAKSQSVKPGKGGSYMQTELKELSTPHKLVKRFRSAESVERAELGPPEPYQYLYTEDKKLITMHVDTFEQLEVSIDMLDDFRRHFLHDGIKLEIQIYNGQPLYVTLPAVAEATIRDTEQGSNLNTKVATLDNGAEIRVPLFVNAGDRVKVDLENAKFKERL